MPAQLPVEIDGQPFAVHKALRLGVGPDRLRRRDLRADFHGIRVPRDMPADLESRCRAYAPRLQSGQHFSHVTAARLWGLRMPLRFDVGPLHVTTTLPARAPRTRGVVGHHIDAPGFDLALHRGFLLPTPTETWRTLAPFLTLDELVIAGDGLVSRRDARETTATLRRAVARNSRQRGNLALRAAFELVRPGTDSGRETILRLVVVRAGLPEPEVNGRLTGLHERARFGDLVFRRWGIVAEYEGAQHQESRQAYLDDIDRFEELGTRWRFVRIAKEHSDAEIVARVTAALRRAGWRP